MVSTPLKNIRQNWESSPNRGEKNIYLSCHHLVPNNLELENPYVVDQDTHKKTCIFETPFVRFWEVDVKKPMGRDEDFVLLKKTYLFSPKSGPPYLFRPFCKAPSNSLKKKVAK